MNRIVSIFFVGLTYTRIRGCNSRKGSRSVRQSVFEKIEAINHDNGVTVLIVEQSPGISVHRRY